MSDKTPIEILIVEDDQFNARLLSDVCVSAGYTCRVAIDGVEALEAVGERRPDLVLLDIMIPRLNGFGVLAQLRAAPGTRHLPVILVSAIQDDETRFRGIEMGADDYAKKPFKIGELRRQITTHLNMAARKLELGIAPEPTPTA